MNKLELIELYRSEEYNLAKHNKGKIVVILLVMSLAVLGLMSL